MKSKFVLLMLMLPALVVLASETAIATPVEEPQQFLSDSLRIETGGVPIFLGTLSQSEESGGTFPPSLSADVRGTSVDFFKEVRTTVSGVTGSGVSDNVTFGPFNVRFFSDTEAKSPTFTPERGAIVRTIMGERATVALDLTSDTAPGPAGSEPERGFFDFISLDLITPNKPVDPLKNALVGPEGPPEGRETANFDVPQIVIEFARSNEPSGSTISDILVINPIPPSGKIPITVTSDGRLPLPATGNFTIPTESGAAFSITAESDVPEPGTLLLFATSILLLGAGVLGAGVRRHRSWPRGLSATSPPPTTSA